MSRNKEGMKSGIVGIVANTVLFISKIVIGLLSGSVSIIADAINNLSDSVSSILTFAGYYMSNKPADKEHPFGHERFEYISGFVISFIMLILSFEIILSSIESIKIHEFTKLNTVGLFVLVFSIVVKGMMYLYYRKQGKRINSEVLMANAQDSLNDVLITGSILFSNLLGLKIDGYLGLLIAAIIIISALKMLSEFISELLGERPDQNLIDGIVAILKESKSIYGFHDLMIHAYGKNNVYSVVHVEVDERLSLIDAHDIIHEIEEAIFDKTGIIMDVHLDPLDIQSPEIKEIVKIIKETLKALDIRLKFHDVRILGDKILVDIVKNDGILVPEEDIYDIITDRLKEHNVPYVLEIHFDSLDLLSD